MVFDPASVKIQPGDAIRSMPADALENPEAVQHGKRAAKRFAPLSAKVQ